MADGSRTLKLSILADVDNLKKGLGQAGDETNSFGGKIGEFGKKAALAFAAVGVAVGVMAVKFAKDAIVAGEAASTANARIEQINTSMGLFGDSTGQVSAALINYAEVTARATGVDTNSIKATQAKLLTFKELAATANEVGGQFERATKAAIDLGAAGFGTAESNAVALGKALNDPIKGITALTRNGITFTESEKDRITVLVESNKVGEAQNMILQAIETQVGGTAEATANASDKMKVGFEQVTATVGLALLPVFEQLSNFVLDVVFPLFDKLGKLFSDDLILAFNTVKTFIVDTLVPAFKMFWEYLNRFIIPILVATLKPAIQGIKNIFGALGNLVSDNTGFFKLLGAGLTAFLVIAKPVAGFIGTTFKAAFNGIALIINGVSLAIKVLTGTINGIITGLNLLISGYNIVNNLKPGSKDLAKIPKLAQGGMVSANKPYIVGEVGPELFVPSSSGRIVPNNKLGSGGGNIYINVSGAIDQEGTARRIVDVLNNSFYRGTNGANALAF
jgi:hypothetical protein